MKCTRLLCTVLDLDLRAISVEGAMTPATLGQYFRSFLIKLTMVESQLGILESLGQNSLPTTGLP